MFPFIADQDFQALVGSIYSQVYLLAGIIRIAMHDGVDQALAHRNADAMLIFFVETEGLGLFEDRIFADVDGFQA